MPPEKTEPKNQGQQIKQLFDQCLDLPHEQQIKIISQSSASATVKTHVSKLLKFTAEDISITQAVVDTVQVSLDIKPIKAGMKIGAYELKQTLGIGGQGEVWLADRIDGNFQHQVAIKFLKPVHDQKELSRFEAERKVLASLKHPNIAQLLDGGELGDHRPYMVLEYVEGLPLLEYGENKKFSLRKYLRVFLQICEAVSFAHSHSIIHRDIKPSNIYVTYDGTVKLLDFGIAKFIDKDDVKTQTLPVMTLAYSSPEQITGAPVSTATDVYSLGLLLYEMLTGQRAQAIHNDAPIELIHEITQRLPTPPSGLSQHVELHRSYSIKQLKGDLDNLILMALRKEPERRYSSVEAMSNDIRSFLDGKPLVAVADTWRYRAKKFINRNPLATLLSSALLVFMVALPLTLLNNQKHLKIERDKALLAQKEAQEQTTIANRTTDFLVNILESASPLASKGEAVNLDDVLASAERQLSAGLDEQPKVKATLLSKLGGIQHQLGHHEKAVEYYQAVLDLYKHENNLPGQAYAYGQLGIMAFFASDETAALRYQQSAVELTHAVVDAKELAWHHIRIATIDGFFDKKPLVINRLEKTLASLQSAGIEDAAILGRIFNELSIVTDDKELALNHIRQAVKYAEQLNGRMHPLFQTRYESMAQRLKDLERYDEAEAILLESRESSRKLFTEKHPTYSAVVAELGALYHDKGRFTEVKEIYQEAIDISLQVSGKKSLNYVLQINNLAYLYEDMGRYDEAEPLYRESVELRKTYHSGNPYRVASSMGNLARLLAKKGQYAESQTILDEIIPIYTAQNESNTQNYITAVANLLQDNPSQETCQAANQEVEIIVPEVNKMSENSWRRMYSELWLGELLLKCNENELAKKLLLAAKHKSQNIYVDNSDGQLLIQSKVNQWLSRLNN